MAPLCKGSSRRSRVRDCKWGAKKEKRMKNIFPKILYYSFPVLLGAIIIFLEIWGISGIWKLLWVVFVLLLGSILLYKGKAWGSAFGVLFGIYIAASGIEQIPHRLNMGNAGPKIEPTWENVQWYIWHTEIIWGVVIALFFVALGIFVFMKNRNKK